MKTILLSTGIVLCLAAKAKAQPNTFMICDPTGGGGSVSGGFTILNGCAGPLIYIADIDPSPSITQNEVFALPLPPNCPSNPPVPIDFNGTASGAAHTPFTHVPVGLGGFMYYPCSSGTNLEICRTNGTTVTQLSSLSATCNLSTGSDNPRRFATLGGNVFYIANSTTEPVGGFFGFNTATNTCAQMCNTLITGSGNDAADHLTQIGDFLYFASTVTPGRRGFVFNGTTCTQLGAHVPTTAFGTRSPFFDLSPTLVAFVTSTGIAMINRNTGAIICHATVSISAFTNVVFYNGLVYFRDGTSGGGNLRTLNPATCALGTIPSSTGAWDLWVCDNRLIYTTPPPTSQIWTIDPSGVRTNCGLNPSPSTFFSAAFMECINDRMLFAPTYYPFGNPALGEPHWFDPSACTATMIQEIVPGPLTPSFNTNTEVTACGYTFPDPGTSSLDNSLVIFYENTTPMDVSGIALQGNWHAGSLVLNWEVANQGNLLGFNVLKGTTPAVLSKIGYMAANPSVSVYDLVDDTNDGGLSAYYQIEGVDSEGRRVLSNLIHVAALNAQGGLAVLNGGPHAPGNPVIVVNRSGQPEELEMLDITGRSLAKQTIAAASTGQFSTEGLASGVYLLRGRGFSQRILVQ